MNINQEQKELTELEFIERLIKGTEAELNKHRDFIKKLMVQKKLLYIILKKLKK